jgi:phage terminase large subunit GpA-like protein
MSTNLSPGQRLELNRALSKGLNSFETPEPLRLSEWAAENFYLSSESSYIEGQWESFPYQPAIMDCISNDDIREVTWVKSARVGYTKIVVASIGYFAEHKKRNQAIWQPTDEDRNEFVKSEVDPMIRDCPTVRAVFPWFDKKHKNNTLQLKVFADRALYMRGGKAAKNYRRISVDAAYLDELDGFDNDIQMEGDPVTLAAKRIEGATFPKLILGSTPKIKNLSMIEHRASLAECYFRFKVPCPHCEIFQALRWGGRDAEFGFKWVNNDPKTAAHLCGECGGLCTQAQYLEQWTKGYWETEDGIWIDGEGFFRDEKDKIIDTPNSVAFHIWTAYSPMTSLAQIVKEFFGAKDDPSKLKTFVNTTLGESWEEDESEKVESETLYGRRERFDLVPEQCVAITFGIDTQDDRFEIQWDAWGPSEERWTLDYQRLYGDPSRGMIWDKLAEALVRTFKRQDGILLTPLLGCQDHGGHYSDEVNTFSKRMGIRFLVPTKGSSIYGQPVAKFPRQKNDKGVYLTSIGTDTAKDLMYQRLKILKPGPGYWHFRIAECFDGDYYKQLTAEERRFKWAQGQRHSVWDSKGRRNEPWDISVLSLAAVRILQQHFGLILETHNPENAATKQGRRMRSKGIGN